MRTLKQKETRLVTGGRSVAWAGPDVQRFGVVIGGFRAPPTEPLPVADPWRPARHLR